MGVTEIKMIHVDEIIPYARNPRRNDDTVAAVAASIKEFGFQQPIVVDSSKTIIVGHTRWRAAKLLRMDLVPVIIAENLTPQQAKAYRLIDNKTAELSTWDAELLSIEVAELPELRAWEEMGVSFLIPPMPESGDTSETDITDVDVPALQENCQTLVGDLWFLGKNREHILVCGDSTKPEHVDLLFAGSPDARMVLTDPPYGVSYQGKTAEALTLENDDLSEDNLSELWNTCLSQIDRFLMPGGTIYATVPPGPLLLAFANPMRQRGWLRQFLIWHKDQFVLGRSDYHYQHETLLYGWKLGAAHYFIDDRSKSSVLSFDRPRQSKEHPTMKPLALWTELVKNNSKPGDIVYDPFCGSGTTVIAAHRTGRHSRSAEIDPHYCDVILRRFHGETNILPVTSSGKVFDPG